MLFLDTGSSIFQFVQVSIIFGVVIVICILVTRFIGNYQKGVTMNTGMQVIQTARIANNKYLQVVKIGERYVVLGISKDNITMLMELSKEEADSLAPKKNGSFSKSLGDIMSKMKDSFPKR